MLKLNKTCVGYGRRVIIDNVSFEAEAGEIITLIGPNGSGKSTILKTITRQLQIIGGNIEINSASYTDFKEKDFSRLVSMVMTEQVKTELMTCRDVVATGRYPYTGRMGILTDEDWQKVASAIERVDATDVADEDFMKISDGQRQRIMLARALCQEPEIMLLDEPTSYLDLKYKLSLLDTIKSLAEKDGITIVMSLHELELAKAISDRLVCIKNNAVDKIGTPEEIFSGEYISQLFDVDLKAYGARLGITWRMEANK